MITKYQKHTALLFMSFACLVNVNVRWLVLTVPWVGLQCVIAHSLTSSMWSSKLHL